MITATLPAYAQTDIEVIDVVGTRTPLYDTRDVNAAALGIKDPLDLPISVQSFSEELMTNQRARTLGDVLINDASVQNTAIGTVFDFVSVRGFQLDWNNGLRRDGLALAPYQDVALENIQRIDVLKGPSSIVAGFNNTGGTINYVTKRPTQTQFTELTAEVKSHNGRYVHLDTGGPLDPSAQFGYRVNAAVENNGDFSGGDDVERTFVSVALDWQVSDQLFLRLDADTQDKAIVSQPLIGLNYDEDGNKHLPPYVDTSDVLLGQPWARYETKTYNTALRLDYYLNDDWQWVNQVSMSANDRFTIFPDIYAVAENGDVLSAVILVTPDESYDVISGHSFIEGNFYTGEMAHQFVMGVSGRKLESFDGRWFELENPVGNLFNPVHTSRPAFPAYPDGNETNTTETSFFITDTWHFNDAFFATLGWRHIHYKKEMLEVGSKTHPETGNLNWILKEDEIFNVPLVGLSYKPNDDTNVYFSYSEGAGEGSVAVIGSGILNEGEALGPKESEQIELGVKMRTDSMTMTLAAFELERALEYHNKTTNYFTQDGLQQHRGVEFNLNGQVTDDLAMVASATVINAKMVDLDGEPDLNGNRAMNVPKYQANAYFDYRLPFAPDVNVNMAISYVGEREQNTSNDLQVPSYTRFDAGVTWHKEALVEGVDATVRFKAENVFDKAYWLSAGAKGIDWGVSPGRGRMLTLSATLSF